MTTRKTYSYFPVDPGEQRLLERVREQDLAEVLGILDLVAQEKLTLADLDQAVQLWQASREQEDLAARFQNLEARMKERVEKGLAEIEGRLSKRFAGETGTVEPPPAPPPSVKDTVPEDANLAFLIDGEVVWGPTAAKFYVAVWEWIVAHGYVKASDLPIKSGSKRHILASSPVHPTGKDFFKAHEIAPGMWLEAHASRANLFARVRKSLDQYGIPYDVLLGVEP